MRLEEPQFYRVQAVIWAQFERFIFKERTGWPAWEAFLLENGMEREGGVLDFHLQRDGRVSVLDPSSYGRLWMDEDFAQKVILLGGVP